LRRAYSSYAQRLAYVHGKLGLGRPRLLDYGAGFGVFSEVAMKMGFDVTALEFSEDRKLRLRKKGIKTIANIKESADTYDFVNIDQVLEHLSSPRLILKSILPLLQQNGCIYISVPISRGLRRYLVSAALDNTVLSVNHMLSASPLQHINSFSRKALLLLANACGLRSVFSPLGELVSGAGFARSTRDFLRPFYRYLTTSLYFQKSE